jgi:hypothetical protein
MSHVGCPLFGALIKVHHSNGEREHVYLTRQAGENT